MSDIIQELILLLVIIATVSTCSAITARRIDEKLSTLVAETMEATNHANR